MKKLQLHEYKDVAGHWKETGRIDITPEMLLEFVHGLTRKAVLECRMITAADIAEALEKKSIDDYLVRK